MPPGNPGGWTADKSPCEGERDQRIDLSNAVVEVFGPPRTCLAVAGGVPAGTSNTQTTSTSFTPSGLFRHDGSAWKPLARAPGPQRTCLRVDGRGRESSSSKAMVVLMLNGTAQHDVADAFAAWLRDEAGPQPDPTQEDGQQPLDGRSGGDGGCIRHRPWKSTSWSNSGTTVGTVVSCRTPSLGVFRSNDRQGVCTISLKAPTDCVTPQSKLRELWR
jgi:hypothetical protein